MRKVAAALATVACIAVTSTVPAHASTTSAIPPGTITVSAASSLTDVFPVIAASFRRAYPQVAVRFSFGSSAALIEQVRAGAPVDVVATASEATMQAAERAGLVSRPLRFARNTMAIAMPPGNPAGVDSLADLSHVSVAVCEISVPCGAAASALFKRNSLIVKPTTKELDVRAVMGRVLADQVDAGVVYATDVRAAGRKVTSLSIPSQLNVSTTYPIATVASSSQPAAARAFSEFVRYNPTAQAILRNAGFGGP